MTEIFIFNVAKLAVKSVINVAALYPKPGLITPLTKSALDGIDFVTLTEGAMALFQCLVNCGAVGSESESMKPEEAFTLLKSPFKIGIQDVLQATRGKMSLSGHIFFTGLITAAAGRLVAQRRILTPGALMLAASSFARGIVERELWGIEQNDNPEKTRTPSERAYIQYGFEGCRGEAEKNFPNVLAALSLYRELVATQGQLDFRERAVHVLLSVMATLNDTTVAFHNGISELLNLQNESQNILRLGGATTLKGTEKIFEFDKNLTSKGISPRASALILATALFVNDITQLKNTRSGYSV